MQVRRYLFGLVLLTFVVSCRDGRRPAFVDADDTSPPVRGGTLKVVGLSDVDHLAPTSAYSTSSIGLLTNLTRQLVAYPLSMDFETATKVAPDLAEILPTVENGGISADSRTYTFHLRRGVLWNTTPPREVNAHDLVRGLKLICNPVNPCGCAGLLHDNDRGHGGLLRCVCEGSRNHCRHQAFCRKPGNRGGEGDGGLHCRAFTWSSRRPTS